MVDEFDSVVLALLTSFERAASPTRVLVEPSPSNSLTRTSYVMTEKLFTVPCNDLGTHVGTLTEEQMHAVARALAHVLAITVEDVPRNG
jgi:mRNA-degrading endonuclease toxin of MazEF toxin-antitoxin module